MNQVKVSVILPYGSREIRGRVGQNLRSLLLANGLSPYQGCFAQLNCKGSGICGTCQIDLKEEEGFFSRRSCQIQCFRDMVVRLGRD